MAGEPGQGGEAEKTSRAGGGEPGVEIPNPSEPQVVPALPDPPARHGQDTQAVEGADAMNLPEETRESVQRQPIQG